MTNQQRAPEALRTIRRFYRGNDCMAENQAGDWVRYEDHVAAMVKAQQPAPSAAAAVSDEDEALDLLATLFDAWESGTPCYEEPESSDGFLGHAFRLDDEVFHRCADLLNRRRGKQPSTTPQADSQPAAVMDREAVIRAAVAAMPHTNPMVADDLLGGFTMHTEADDVIAIFEAGRAARAPADSVTAPQQEAQEPVAWLSPWRADRVTTDYDAYGEHGIPLYTAPQPAPTQEAQEPCPTCAALARTVMLDQVSFDRKPDCYGIRQITDDEGVEEWEDIRTSPDVAREEANDMMATGRGEIYEVVPLWTTPQPSLTAKAADSVLEDAARLERERICAAIKAEDDYCVDQGDYMLDSDDCIKIVRGEWVRPDFAVDAARKQGANHD